MHCRDCKFFTPRYVGAESGRCSSPIYQWDDHYYHSTPEKGRVSIVITVADDHNLNYEMLVSTEFGCIDFQCNVSLSGNILLQRHFTVK
jgi:hypothetical protein